MMLSMIIAVTLASGPTSLVRPGKYRSEPPGCVALGKAVAFEHLFVKSWRLMPSRFRHERLAHNHFEQVTCTTGMAIAAKAYRFAYQIGEISPL